MFVKNKHLDCDRQGGTPKTSTRMKMRTMIGTLFFIMVVCHNSTGVRLTTCCGKDLPVLEILPFVYKCDEHQVEATPSEIGETKVGIDATGQFIIGYAKEIKQGKYVLCPFIIRSKKAILVIAGNTANTYIKINPEDMLYDLFFKKISNIRKAVVVEKYF